MVFGYNERRPRKEDYEAFVDKFSKGLEQISGSMPNDELSLMLYGSYVRGDYVPGRSGIDAVLIFPDDVVTDKTATRKISKLLHEILIERLQNDLDILGQDYIENIQVISSELEQSSIELTMLQEDVADIQVQSLDFTGIIDEVIQSVVSIFTEDSQGSGVIISEDGYIVTNHHVIEDAKTIKILTADGKIRDADLIGLARVEDIALLKIDGDNFPFLEFGDSDDIKVGEHVIAVGNPAGLSFSVTEGIVSATRRKGSNGLEAYMQIDVPINPGNSGGPLINIHKEIIGINNFKIGGFESLGFAIDSNHVKDVVDEIFQELSKLEEQ